ncbi:hypothetical protein EDD16DRAFT_1474955, partial [Pisolithus croceorrhizus]
EMKQFLKPTTFNILPYPGHLDSCKDWWMMLYGQSCQLDIQCIILAVNLAIQAGANAIFQAGEKDQPGTAKLTSWFPSLSPSTLYGHQYGFFIVNGAHLGWKYNALHMAF